MPDVQRNHSNEDATSTPPLSPEEAHLMAVLPGEPTEPGETREDRARRVAEFFRLMDIEDELFRLPLTPDEYFLEVAGSELS